MDMTLRFEIFPDDLDVIADFYQRVLGFSLVTDQRHTPAPYLSLQRGTVRVGASGRAAPRPAAAGRRGTGARGGRRRRRARSGASDRMAPGGRSPAAPLGAH